MDQNQSQLGAAPVSEEEPLCVFGEKIPPSQVSDQIPNPFHNFDTADAYSDELLNYESKTWECLKKVIFQLVEGVNSENLMTTVAKLLAENIVRGKCFFAAACMRYQSENVHRTRVFASLAGLVMIHFPCVVTTLFWRIEFEFFQLCNRLCTELPQSAEAAAIFLAHMACMNVYPMHTAERIVEICLEKKTKPCVMFAATVCKELKNIWGYFLDVPMYTDVREQFSSIIANEELETTIREMAREVIEKVPVIGKVRACCIQDIPVWFEPVLSKLQCSLDKDTIFLYSLSRRGKRILRDGYNHDVYFLERERAYHLFLSIILREGHWFSQNKPKLKHKSHFRIASEKPESPPDPNLEEDKVLFCLEIIKYSLFGPKCLIPHLEFLCKRNEKEYKKALEICFFVMWLMAGTSSAMTLGCFSGELISHGLLSWELLRHLPLNTEDVARSELMFLSELFASLDRIEDALTNLLENGHSRQSLMHFFSYVDDRIIFRLRTMKCPKVRRTREGEMVRRSVRIMTRSGCDVDQ